MSNYREKAQTFKQKIQDRGVQSITQLVNQIERRKPVFGQNYFYQLYPQAKPPEKEPGTIESVFMPFLAYAKFRATTMFSDAKIDTDQAWNQTWNAVKINTRHFVKSNFTYAGLKAQGPALYWGLMGTLAVFTVFGGLATFGILPLTLALFTIPGMGTMTIGNFIVPIAGTIGAKIGSTIARVAYGKEINKNLDDALELDDLNDQITAERKDLVLRHAAEPEVKLENDEEDDLQKEFDQNPDEAYEDQNKRALTA
jgi:hypothetical protein